MDRSGRVVVVLILALSFLLAVDVSAASFLSRARLLLVPHKSDDTGHVSPSPSAAPPLNQLTSNSSNPKNPNVPVKTDSSNSTTPPKALSTNNNSSSVVPVKAENSNSTTPKPSNNMNTTTSVDNSTSKTAANSNVATPSSNSTATNNDNSKKKEDEDMLVVMDPYGRAKTKRKKGSIGVNETCSGHTRRCTDRSSLLMACIVKSYTETKKVEILIQNEGDDMLRVDISAPIPTDNALIEMPEHLALKVNLTAGEKNEIILRDRAGKCVLHVDRLVSERNLVLYLPSFDKLVTPINGAYFLILTAIVFGGTWAWCMCCKKRRQRGGGGGVPYQELEMGLPESANNVETTDGWDQGWDDDWNEENAIKSPAARVAASISGNGLTSRTTNKDGWDNDWDD